VVEAPKDCSLRSPDLIRANVCSRVDLPNDTKVSKDTFVNKFVVTLLVLSYLYICFDSIGFANEQNDWGTLMRFYFRHLTVKEGDGGDVINRKARIVVHPILDWFDDLGVYHQLIFSASDINWLSKVKISIKDLNT
jgi:hypothetical protein